MCSFKYRYTMIHLTQNPGTAPANYCSSLNQTSALYSVYCLTMLSLRYHLLIKAFMVMLILNSGIGLYLSLKSV